MLVLKYICAVIAIFCTVMYLTTLISDIVFPPSLKAIELNMSEDKVFKASTNTKIILTLIMAITWPVLFLF